MDYCYWVYRVFFFFFFCCRVIFVNSHTQSEGPQILISQEDPDLIFRPVKMKKKKNCRATMFKKQMSPEI